MTSHQPPKPPEKKPAPLRQGRSRPDLPHTHEKASLARRGRLLPITLPTRPFNWRKD